RTLQAPPFFGGPSTPMRPRAPRPGLGTLPHTFFGAASQKRFEARFRLLQDLDEPLRNRPYNEVMAAYASYFPRAKSMMYVDSVDSVFKFSVDEENRYGANSTGRSLLVARNAIRAKNGVV